MVDKIYTMYTETNNTDADNNTWQYRIRLPLFALSNAIGYAIAEMYYALFQATGDENPVYKPIGHWVYGAIMLPIGILMYDNPLGVILLGLATAFLTHELISHLILMRG